MITERRLSVSEFVWDPVKIAMLIVLLAMEIPAAIFLVVAWVRACSEAKKLEDDNANF